MKIKKASVICDECGNKEMDRHTKYCNCRCTCVLRVFHRLATSSFKTSQSIC